MSDKFLIKLDVILGAAPFKAIRLTDQRSAVTECGDVDWLVKSPSEALSYIRKLLHSNEEKIRIVNCRHHSTGIRLNLVDGNGNFFYGPDFVYKFGRQSDAITQNISQLLAGEVPVTNTEITYARFLFNYVRGVERGDLYTRRLERLLSLSKNLDLAAKNKLESIIGYQLDYIFAAERSIKLAAPSRKQRLIDLAWKGYSKLSRLKGAKPLTIVFLGVDGAGKSTVISEVKGRLDLICIGSDYFHLKPSFFKEKAIVNNASVLPHGKESYGNILSILKALHLYGSYLVVPLFSLKASVMGRCVIFDRYFFDLYVDPERFRYSASKSFVLMLLKLIPYPDLVIYLNGDAETIHNRKPELTVDMIKDQDRKYKELFKLLGLEVVSIDTCNDLSSTVKLGMSHVVGNYVGHYDS